MKNIKNLLLSLLMITTSTQSDCSDKILNKIQDNPVAIGLTASALILGSILAIRNQNQMNSYYDYWFGKNSTSTNLEQKSDKESLPLSYNEYLPLEEKNVAEGPLNLDDDNDLVSDTTDHEESSPQFYGYQDEEDLLLIDNLKEQNETLKYMLFSIGFDYDINFLDEDLQCILAIEEYIAMIVNIDNELLINCLNKNKESILEYVLSIKKHILTLRNILKEETLSSLQSVFDTNRVNLTAVLKSRAASLKIS